MRDVVTQSLKLFSDVRFDQGRNALIGEFIFIYSCSALLKKLFF